jgi:2-hydroxychromene-2-carboxylate isomerase
MVRQRGPGGISDRFAQVQSTPGVEEAMGVLIDLGQHRASQAGAPGSAEAPRTAPAGVTFAFQAGSPWTYLVAERVERRFAGVRWLPVAGTALGLEPRVARRAVERRAAELGLPLVWPEGGVAVGQGVARVAKVAAARGCAAGVVLAAGRLAYCGGYDLDDPDVLAEAAAAGGLDPAAALEAACDRALDRPMLTAAARLSRRGASDLPALQVGRTLFCGERGIADATVMSPGLPTGCRDAL